MNHLKEKFGEKLLPGMFSIFLLALVLSPIVENWRSEAKDGFPLSHYPMFTNKRGETASVTHLVGIDADGKRLPIHYRYGGEGGMNQARKQIAKRAKSEESAAEFCREIAGKIAEKNQKSLAQVVEVQIITSRYNLENYFVGDKTPVKEKLNVSCKVDGRI